MFNKKAIHTVMKKSNWILSRKEILMDDLSQNDRGVWKFWESKSTIDVVREAATKGTHIYLAHRFIELRENWDKESTAKYFMAEVCEWVLNLLQRGNYYRATHVLEKMKIPVNEHLLALAKNNPDRNLRDFLMEHIVDRNKKLENEPDSGCNDEWKSEWSSSLSNWHLLKTLEFFFIIDGLPKQSCVFGKKDNMFIVTSGEKNEFTLEKMETMPLEWKRTLATHLFVELFGTFFDFNLLTFVDVEMLWRSLIEENKVIVLRRWIALSNRKYLQYDASMTDASALRIDTMYLSSPDSLKKLDDMFSRWTITDSMISYVAVSFSYGFTKLCIYDALCAFGYVEESEKDNMKLILRRLCRTKNLHNIDKIFFKGDKSFRSHLNDMIANHSLDNNLYHVMTSCVDRELLPMKIDDIDKTDTENALELWLLSMAVHETKNTSHYPRLIYESCKYLTTDMSLYFSNNPDVILATLLFSNGNIFDVFNENNTLHINGITLSWNEPLSNALPHLNSTYHNWKNNSLVSVNDVTVYKLLNGYKRLDMSKVFEFQLSGEDKFAFTPLDKMNDFNNEQPVEFPHFSNAALCKKFGYERKLNYMYYLKQNRPCMASQNLIFHHYQTFRRINISMLKKACAQAHARALMNWNDPITTGCCVAFIKMIACDPTRCRVHISCAKIIADYLQAHEKYFKEDTKEKVDEIMRQLIDNETSAFQGILDKLEMIYLIYEEDRIDYDQVKDIGDLIMAWQTIMKFALLHKLPLPLNLLKRFASRNLWLPLFIIGDIFKYSVHDMLNVCREIPDKSLRQHLIQSIKSRSMHDVDYEHNEDSVRQEEANNFTTDDLWEVMAVCHTMEDPPTALVKASALFHSPVPALLATCYEPDALDVFWTQWTITSIRKIHTQEILSSDVRDASDMNLTDEKIREIIKICIKNNYYRTLHDAFSIFYRKSPLYSFMGFLVRTVYYLTFDDRSIELLDAYETSYKKCKVMISGTEGHLLPRFLRPKFIYSVVIDLIILTLSNAFDNSWHQKKFLKCLCKSNLDQNKYRLPLSFHTLLTLLEIGIECDISFNLAYVCVPEYKEALETFIRLLISNNHFDAARRAAEVTDMTIDDIVIREWTYKYEMLLDEIRDAKLNDFAILQFWTKCSNTLKESNINWAQSVQFLKSHCDQLTSNLQKFYFLRLILIWFDGNAIDYKSKDSIEREMWNIYLTRDEIDKFHLLSINNTYDYLLNLNSDSLGNDCDFKELPLPTNNPRFQHLYDEIIAESNLLKNPVERTRLKDSAQSDKWYQCLEDLLNMGLMAEAWRLNMMFEPVPEYKYDYNPVEVVEVCLKLAEGIIMPQDLSVSIRKIIAPAQSAIHPSVSDSRISEMSCEEYVVVPEKEDNPDDSSQCVNTIDTAIVSILDTLAVKTGYPILKQISNYYKISLQVEWSYEKIVKFDGNPFDLITKLSGRSRMPLAKLVLQTFDIPSQNITEYLSLEIVTAIISSHLTRTSGFLQKEHFHYTVWGYPVHSDFEMFLNLWPDQNSALGKLLLEYLSAFRKWFKDKTVQVQPSLDEEDEISRVESVLEEEYQNIDDEEVERASIKMGLDTQSIMSSSINTQISRRNVREKKHQLDVISCTNVNISSNTKSHLQCLLKSTKMSSKQINVISIELLILAHECFSSICDTEGIATILRSAQTLAHCLNSAYSWGLLVRLLTGIGRYTEMAYIFQMLKDSDQFEQLLGQFDHIFGLQQDKIDDFKLGILNYLRKFCPTDTEAFQIVALRFSMFSEIGALKRKQANDMIVTAKQLALDSMKLLKKSINEQNEWIVMNDNQSTLLLLDTASQLYTDSAEAYAKDGCYGAAREMASKAQLIALQSHLCKMPPSAKCIIDISPELMTKTLREYLNFMEGLVFAHANEMLGGGWTARWKDIVYEKVVVDKNIDFTRDIMMYRPDIAVYILEKYDFDNTCGNDIETIAELRSLFK